MAEICWNMPPDLPLQQEVSLYNLRKERNKKIMVVGVGDAGCTILDYIAYIGLIDVNFLKVSTSNYFVDKKVDHCWMTLGEGEINQFDTNGDYVLGQRLAFDNRILIGTMIENFDIVIIVSGLGGGIGTGAAPVVAGIARHFGALTISVVTMPLPCEGKKRINNAEYGFERICSLSDGVMFVPTLPQDSRTTKQEVFDFRAKYLYQMIKGIVKFINNVEGVFDSNFMNIKMALHHKDAVFLKSGDNIVKFFDVTITGAKTVCEAAHEFINSPIAKPVLSTSKNIFVHFILPYDSHTDRYIYADNPSKVFMQSTPRDNINPDDVRDAFHLINSSSLKDHTYYSLFSTFHRPDNDARIRILVYAHGKVEPQDTDSKQEHCKEWVTRF